MSMLKETWSQCLQGHTSLFQLVPEAKRDAIEYFQKEMFDEYYDIYQTTLEYMNECLEEIEPVQIESLSSNQLASQGHKQCASSLSLSHLPPINLPPFSEKFENWESYRDRFTSLIIANKDLSAFSRMHFLTSSLTGRALESIKNIPVTADNFDIAWKTLVSRYENKCRLIDIHVSTLYNLPNVARENTLELNDLRDKANRALASLKNLKRLPEDILSDMLVHCVSQKLDPATRKAWKLKGGDKHTVPSYEELDTFIESRACALEELTPPIAAKFARSQKIISASTSAAPTTSCPMCKASHFINKCPQFVKKSPTQRLDMIKQAKRYTNCLSAKHAVQSCPSKFSCRTCQKRHHSMLHVDSESAFAEIDVPTSVSPTDKTHTESVTALFSTTQISSRPAVLLATARVRIASLSGRNLIVRALFDQGSEVTFITERLVQSLKLRRLKLPVTISAVGCIEAGICRYAANIQLSPCESDHPILTTTASILRSLTKYSPAPVYSNITWTHLANLPLADPDLTSAESIDIIIGADLYGDVIQEEIRRGSRGQPIAQKTILG